MTIYDVTVHVWSRNVLYSRTRIVLHNARRAFMLSAMRITLRRTFAAVPEVYDLPWGGPGGFVQMLRVSASQSLRSQTKPTEKPAELALFALGAFDVPAPNPRTGEVDLSYRANNLNPIGLCGIALDYDDVPHDVMRTILNKAREFSPRGLAYTTWKHGLGPEGTGRVRIVMPFEPRYVEPRDWPCAWQRIHLELGGHADTQCKDVNRTYYLPCTNEQAPEWARPCWFESWGES